MRREGLTKRWSFSSSSVFTRLLCPSRVSNGIDGLLRLLERDDVIRGAGEPVARLVCATSTFGEGGRTACCWRAFLLLLTGVVALTVLCILCCSEFIPWPRLVADNIAGR